MKKIHLYLPWTLRILIFLLFMLSGIAKMFPLWAFEKQLVDLGICNWCSAPYLARFVIAVELGLGIAILQNHFIRRLIIPATLLLLVAFCIHLGIQMYQFGPNNGNCGCFGQLIPMTPLEAFIKNIITILMLIYVWVHTPHKPNSNIAYPLLIMLACGLFMYMVFPFCPCEKKESLVTDPAETQLYTSENPLISTTTIDSPLTTVTTTSITPRDTQNKKAAARVDTLKPEVPKGPKPVVSRFSAKPVFDNQKVDLNKGKKIVCMFAPGCDHCRETAKEICEMKKQAGFPDVYIMFMDEETNLIPDFFKAAGCRFPSQVLSIGTFWDMLGNNATTPGVFGLWNGNIVSSFEGIDKNKFDAAALKKSLELP